MGVRLSVNNMVNIEDKAFGREGEITFSEMNKTTNGTQSFI